MTLPLITSKVSIVNGSVWTLGSYASVADLVAADPFGNRYQISTSDPTKVWSRRSWAFDPAPQTNGGSIVIAITGQSNAAGGNSGGLNPSNAKVFSWDGSTNAFVSGGKYDALPWTRGNPYGNAGNNNYALATAHRLQQATGSNVYVINYSTGGTSIDSWVASGTSSAHYAGLKTEIEAALASLGLSTIDMIIWAQGEQDFGDDYATHLANIQTLNSQWRAETWMQPFTPIFVTGMSDTHDHYEVSAVLRTFCAKSGPSWRYISTKGMPTSDGTHFTGPALFDIGFNRIAPAFLGSHQGEELEPIPFYNRGAGRVAQGDNTAVAVFDHLVGWNCRTDGPSVTDNFTGTGAQTAFTLTLSGTVTTVTVDGVTKTSPTDYSVSGFTITFVSAPASAAVIVVGYAAAVKGPAAYGAISWGYRCASDGNYSAAIGYLNYIPSGVQYSLAVGRGHTLGVNGEAALGMFTKYVDGSRKFQFGIGASNASRKNALGINAAQGNIEIYAPSTAVDPGQNEEITFKLTSTTNLRIVAKCSDGTVRVANLTLA